MGGEDDFIESGQFGSSSRPSPEKGTATSRSEQDRRLLDAVKEWNEAERTMVVVSLRRRQIVWRTIDDGYSVRDVARAFGLSPRRVQQINDDRGRPRGQASQT